METIKDLLEEFFRQAQYKRIDNKENILYRHDIHPDYWIIVEKFSLAEQHKLFESLNENRKQYDDMEKNTTILLLNNLDSAYALNMDQCIEIENDPYLFKKNVLSYKPEVAVKLNRILKAEHTDFSKYLFRESTYEDLEKDTNGVAALAYCIAQKLPFIIMDVETQKYESESFYNKIEKKERDFIDKINELKMENIDKYIEMEILKGVNDEF